MSCRRFPLRRGGKQQYHSAITIEISVLHIRMFLNQLKKRSFATLIFVRVSPCFSVRVRIFPVSRFFAALRTNWQLEYLSSLPCTTFALQCEIA